MLNTHTPEIRFALLTVRRAAILACRVQSTMISPILSKNDRSPVTVADFSVQALVAQRLLKSFPDDPLVAEEDASTLSDSPLLEPVTDFVTQIVPEASAEKVCAWIDHGRSRPSSGRYWLLDPIDGTMGFLRGDQYVIALALVENGRVQLGVLGCPHLSDGYRPDVGGEGSLAIAVRGQGSWTSCLAGSGDFARLKVSTRSEPDQARLLRSFEAGHTNVAQIDQVVSALGICAEPVLMDSQAKYAVLAAGKGDLMLRLLSPSQPDYVEKAWDQAAGSLVVEEAGGRITDLDGKPLDFTTGRELIHNRGILVSNDLLHETVLQTLHSLGI
jgi:3'(2'), 5'-bisphosphate nucleotidase